MEMFVTDMAIGQQFHDQNGIRFSADMQCKHTLAYSVLMSNQFWIRNVSHISPFPVCSNYASEAEERIKKR